METSDLQSAESASEPLVCLVFGSLSDIMSRTKRGGGNDGGGRLGRSLVKEKNRSKRSARGGATWVRQF